MAAGGLPSRNHSAFGHRHTGRLVVNASAAAPLARVFRKLYALHFPIHHLSIAAVYGPASKAASISPAIATRTA